MLSCHEMRALESRAFDDGISAESLMEEAGAQIARAIRAFFPTPGLAYVFFGKGHNGGDALVAARHLVTAGWEILNLPAFALDHCAKLTRKKFFDCGARGMHLDCPEPPPSARPVIALDGLLGIGAHGPLRRALVGRIAQMHNLRRRGACVFALDLPSGLDGDTGLPVTGTVRADITLTIGVPKIGLVADTATAHVGRLAVLPLRELSKRLAPHHDEHKLATAATLAPLWPARSFDTHKGNCGRVSIVAGGRGTLGAACLTAEAAVRAGAGLVTLFCPEKIWPLIATRCTPEVMVRPFSATEEILDHRADAIAIGPGLGTTRAAKWREFIRHAPQPMVVDADALNALAEHTAQLKKSAGPRLLTPHPGEMERLAPGSATRPRATVAREFSEKHGLTLLLKGARTIVATPDRALSYNSTGHPGMATGGMGDVLTGVLAALLAQGAEPHDAARLGAWLCGRAAERAIYFSGESAESLAAGSLAGQLGHAFSDLRAGVF